MDYCVITFSCTHAAMTAQSLLNGVIPFFVMPVLREISTGCGISIRFDPQHRDAALAALAASPLQSEEYAFYAVTSSGGNLDVKPL